MWLSRDKEEVYERRGYDDLVEKEECRRKEGKETDDRYPTSLAYLTLLRSPLFRERLRDPIFAKDIERIGARNHETWYVPSFVFLLYSFLFLSLLSSCRFEMMRRADDVAGDGNYGDGYTGAGGVS